MSKKHPWISGLQITSRNVSPFPVVKNTILAYASSLKAAGFRSVCGTSRGQESWPN